MSSVLLVLLAVLFTTCRLCLVSGQTEAAEEEEPGWFAVGFVLARPLFTRFYTEDGGAVY